MLGGVELEGDGLAGHSDGDVLAHALIDALLGAANLGDIGSLFPAGEQTPTGVSSLELLRDAYGRVRASGYELVNADCVLIGERPRIVDHRVRDGPAAGRRARRRAASRIAVRATTTDRLGFTGRGEGLAAQAVALLSR